MLLRDVLEGIGHTIPFYPRLARAIGSDRGALLLSQLWYWSGIDADDEGWFAKSAEDIEFDVGLSRHEQMSAKKHLKKLGLVDIEKRGMPSRNHYRVNYEKLTEIWGFSSGPESGPLVVRKADHLWSGKRTTVPIIERIKKEEERADLWGGIETFEHILSGKADKLPVEAASKMPLRLAQIVCDRWKDLWGRRAARPTPTRLKEYSRAIRVDGLKPSEFAEAMLGMANDNWPDRNKYCDWKFIRRDAEKWIELYHSSPKVNGKRVSTKIIKGHVVPSNYTWNLQDDFMADNGYKFDVEEGRWAR